MEDVKVEVTPDPNAGVPKKSYRVIAEAGLFKRGRQWEKGEIIELDEVTANGFKALGEIEDAD